jgi:hypothetical protein
MSAQVTYPTPLSEQPWRGTCGESGIKPQLKSVANQQATGFGSSAWLRRLPALDALWWVGVRRDRLTPYRVGCSLSQGLRVSSGPQRVVTVRDAECWEDEDVCATVGTCKLRQRWLAVPE